MATIEDVAKAAGVSASTVSYAISGKRSISAPTKAKVDRAIKELNFHPHAGARALASARTNVLALMTPFRPGLDLAIAMEFISGIVTTARTYGYDVLLVTGDEPGAAARIAGTSSADALIVMDVEMHDARIPTLQALRQPTVLIGVPANPGQLSCVDLDFAAAGRLMVNHLAGLGHTRIGVIGGSPERVAEGANYAIRMLEGVREAAKAADAQVTFEPSQGSFAGGVNAAAKLFERAPEITGLIVHNEAALGGVLDYLERRGLEIPTDLSVIALSVGHALEALPFPVTAIETSGQLIGQSAVEMVMARLTGKRPAEVRFVIPELQERGSTGPARKA